MVKFCNDIYFFFIYLPRLATRTLLIGLYSTLEEYLARDRERAMNWFRTWFRTEPLTFEIIMMSAELGLHLYL